MYDDDTLILFHNTVLFVCHGVCRNELVALHIIMVLIMPAAVDEGRAANGNRDVESSAHDRASTCCSTSHCPVAVLDIVSLRDTGVFV